MSNSEQHSSTSSHEDFFSVRWPHCSLAFAALNVMENVMHVDLTSYENIIAILALILITVFSLAAFMDRRWKSAESRQAFRFERSDNIRPKRDNSDVKGGTSNLYLRYADLSACNLGTDTAEKQIRFHAQAHQNVEENSSKSVGAALP